jgi:hypothetical protein
MKNLTQLINFEYRSKEEVNGWPLIHINLGTNPKTGRARIAKGLVAIGNISVGIVSIGSVAFGVVTSVPLHSAASQSVPLHSAASH